MPIIEPPKGGSNPNLRHQPFAVGGSGDRGVVATANYLARRYGVKSAMPASHARRLCPQLIFVKPDHTRYKEVSQQVLQLLTEVTDIIEPASIDEFYLDLTENNLFKGSASLTVAAVREKISQLGITASAGISNQKMVAKIASDEQKPNGQFLVTPDQVVDYIAQLALKRIPGVGPKSQQLLAQHGLLTGADIQRIALPQLQQILGEKAGYVLHQRCQGIDRRELITDRIRKSVGVEQTLSADMTQLLTAQDYCQQQLLPKLKQRLRIQHWRERPIRTQTVKLKFSDFTQTTVSKASQRVSPSIFYQLLEAAWSRGGDKAVRLIGVSVALPDPGQQQQLELDLD